MGMMIDESIRVISYVKPKRPTSPCGMLKKNAFNTAIDTMRKYQNIQEIIHKIYTSEQADECLVQRLSEIREVLEDGKEKVDL